jgi:CDP-glucose 4,6-dehydratase
MINNPPSTNTWDKTFWRDRPTYVTGATGLLGGWLVRALLDAGADVVCLVRDSIPRSEFSLSDFDKKVKIVRGDLCDKDLVERSIGEYEIDTVFHLAAQTTVGIANRNPVSTFETNIAGTWNLMEACRRSPLVKQIVVASSDKAYGDCENLPYDETTPLEGRHPYDVSKSCADLISQSYAHSFGLPVTVTRCGNLYGGGDLNWNRIVPGTVRSILRGEQPLIYVEDGAAAYMHLAEKLAADRKLIGNAFNFSNELQVTVLDLVKAILAEMGSDLTPIVLNEANNEIRHQYLSAEKARQLLNWSPQFTLNEGLQKSVAWYQDFFANESK